MQDPYWEAVGRRVEARMSAIWAARARVAAQDRAMWDRYREVQRGRRAARAKAGRKKNSA